jgi:hypothetical protein
MLARILLLAALIPACKAAHADRAESRATLSGQAHFPTDLPTTHDGNVRMTIHGVADIDDSCKGDSNQSFTATYDGHLVVQPDGHFDAQLYPNPIITGSGCTAENLDSAHIDSITLESQLGDEVGTGNLTYQTLSAVDGDELRNGAFEDLVGELVFTRQ